MARQLAGRRSRIARRCVGSVKPDGRLAAGPVRARSRPRLSDRSFQRAFVDALRQRADLTVARLSAIPGMRCVAPHAAFYVMPQVAFPAGRTDEDFVLGLLLATGILCVHGSGFSYPADRGAFRLIYLAPLDQLKVICDDIAAFTDEFLHQAPAPGPEASGSTCLTGALGLCARACLIHIRFACDHRLIAWAVARCWPASSSCGRSTHPRALLVIYVSGLLAVGFSPIIRWLEGRRIVGSGRLPRWAAILVVYFGILGILATALALMLPPLMGQAAQLWREMPNDILRIQAVLVEHGLLDHRRTLDEVLKTLPGRAPHCRCWLAPCKAPSAPSARWSRRWCCPSTC